MPKNIRACWRVVAAFSLALFLLFNFAPATFAQVHFHSSSPHSSKYYLALGDSLAFGFQPNGKWSHGYVDDLSKDLSSEDGYRPVANMACNGETSVTFIHGNCPFKQIQKYNYKGPQFEAALDFLNAHKGQVGLVTLDIGGNDTLRDINPHTCVINKKKFLTDLAMVDRNMQIVLPQIYAALTVNGKSMGQLIMMNYYDPTQNICPNTVIAVMLLNEHLANDVSKFGSIVDVFTAFGGPGIPNENICDYTWMCQKGPDIHCNDAGYSLIANLFDPTIR